MQNDAKLSKIIMSDLLSVGRAPLLLMVLILITALSVVYVTQLTRITVAQNDKLLLERDKLEVESRNQILEEYALSEHSRIETVAEQELEMTRPDNKQEIIVSQK